MLLKRITLLLSLILTLAVSSTAVAQEATPPLDPGDIEGLVSGYGRTYIADIESLMATPEALENLAIEDISLSGLAMVMTFEDEDIASDAFSDFSDEFAEGFMEGSEMQAEPSEIDDLGNQAIEYYGETEVDETTVAPSSMIIVQEGEYIYVAMILGGTDVSESSRALAEHLLEAEIPDTEVEFNADGTSTGGVYDIMPNAENADVVQGMIPFIDMEFVSQEDAQ